LTFLLKLLFESHVCFVSHLSLFFLNFLNRLSQFQLGGRGCIVVGDLQKASKHFIFLLQLTGDNLCLLLQMGLFVDSQADNLIHGVDFLAQLHAVLDRFVSLGHHVLQSLLSVAEQSGLCLLTAKLLLQLLVFLHQEMECVL